nr:MAG TPA: hypothetical protein [Caudoviricetes sp.]
MHLQNKRLPDLIHSSFVSSLVKDLWKGALYDNALETF